MTKDNELEPEKLDLKSAGPAIERRVELLQLFPEARTEGGKIDFEQLKRALGEIVDGGKERFGLIWPGKAECFKTIQTQSIAALRPAPKESVNFDTTDNVIIEGDNLEVLKLLQKSYLGKLKLVYIDPPYNTGNDFIYPDNYAESLDTYLEYTGQADSEGRKFGTNTEADGRFHSKWLNMMYPRLYIARNLLKDDGFLVLSIDDAEFIRARALLDEIFGEENHIAVLVWDKNRKNDARYFSVGHEYMIVVAKNKSLLSNQSVKLREPKEGLDEAKEVFDKLRRTHRDNWEAIKRAWRDFYRTVPDSDPRKQIGRFTRVGPRGPFRDDGDISWPGGGGPKYEVLHPVTKKTSKIPAGGWVYSTADKLWEEYERGRVVFGPDETTLPRQCRYLFESDGQVMPSVFYSYAQTATMEFVELMGDRVFENPKNWRDLMRLVRYLSEPNDIVLDFFAGSGTTAHAVLELNRQDGGGRKFILVQLPETTDRTDYPTIVDIAKERVRRVIKNLNDEDDGVLNLNGAQKRDRGFRFFKLAESNFKTWDANAAQDTGALEEQLALHIEHLREGRNASPLSTLARGTSNYCCLRNLPVWNRRLPTSWRLTRSRGTFARSETRSQSASKRKSPSVRISRRCGTR